MENHKHINWVSLTTEEKLERFRQAGYEISGNKIICAKMVDENYLPMMVDYIKYDKLGIIEDDPLAEVDLTNDFDHGPGLWGSTFYDCKKNIEHNSRYSPCRAVKLSVDINDCILCGRWIKASRVEVIELDPELDKLC